MQSGGGWHVVGVTGGGGGTQWGGRRKVEVGGTKWGGQRKVEVGSLPGRRKFSERQIWPWESDYIRGSGSGCRLPYLCG